MINSAHRLSQEQARTNLSFKGCAYAGYPGEETPRAFTLDDTRFSVDKILTRWYREVHSSSRIRADDHRRYVRGYHLDEEVWELVMEERYIDK
ncbi:MAG: hypothetical protein NTAFB01_22850 [Nitrospira sp.]